METGNKVKCINDTGLPDYIIKMGIRKDAILTIRSIGKKDFHGLGGGLRFEGIVTHSDATGYEKAFKRDRFELIN